MRADSHVQLLAGYEVTQLFQQGPRTTTYRGRRLADGQTVFLKLPTAEYPPLQDIALLKHEYQLTRHLEVPGVLKALALEQQRGRPVLVLEDTGCVPLTSGVGAGSLELERFLRLAVQLARTLEQLHARGAIHKDLHPGNILVHRQSGDLRVTGLGFASLLPRETQLATPPALMEGTLAYMSPEQTGRMNRAIDYRTDFYSLGVTLYELLVGRLPFTATDPMELIHCHLAQRPPVPHTLRRDVPAPLSSLLMKLLAKTAEERYQSAHGLRVDLETCLTRWSQAGQLDGFTPGEQDFSDRLQMPQRLYGRSLEQAALLEAFDRVSEGAGELVLVHGYSGVGKSTLVNELHKPVVRRRGYFVSGKFEQFNQGLPYSSLLQALQQLIRQLLTEGEASLASWKAQLLEGLGASAEVIAEVLPEVALIIGAQPAPAPLGPTEAQNRFRQAFQSLIRVFARREHPLVLVLDDLQWADAASRDLLQYLLTSEDLQYLLLLGTYRDNEVEASHPLPRMVAEVRKHRTPVTHLPLSSLSPVELTHWLAEALHREEEEARPLAQLLHDKTDGNPFFVLEFLQALHREGLLRFDPGSRGWRWELEQLRAIHITDNVVDLLVGKLRKLRPETQDALMLAACIGSRFDSTLLSVATERTPPQTAQVLWEAVQQGLLVPLDQGYKLLEGAEPAAGKQGAEAQGVIAHYEFLHDRVQQAAYSLIEEERRKQVHLNIGRLMRQHLSQRQLDEHLFGVVNQLNAGAELLGDEAERREVAKLNLTAGRKAKAASAYDAALGYLTAGSNLLPQEAWQHHHELAFPLHLERAECEYLTARFTEANSRFEYLLEKARSDSDRVAVHTARVVQFLHLGHYEQAVDTGILALRLLGIRLSATPGLQDVLWQLAQVRWRLRGRSPESLLEHNGQVPPEMRAAMNLLISLWFPSFLLKRESLVGLLVLKMVDISLVHGNSEASSFAYACYGMLNSSVFRDPKTGERYGQLALALARRFNDPSVTCRTLFLIACFLNGFSSHLRGNLALLDEAMRCSLEAGNLVQLGYCMNMRLYTTCGTIDTPLSESAEEARRFLEFGRRTDAPKVIQTMLTAQRWVRDLTELAPSVLSSREHSLEPAADITEEMEQALHYLLQLQVAYLFGRYEELLELGARLKGPRYKHMLDPSSGFVHYHAFYCALAALALLPEARGKERKRYRGILQEAQRTLRWWATHGPSNALHKHLLVCAEVARQEGKPFEATELYEQAIQTARQNDYLHEMAMACECAARFHLGRGRDSLAGAYLQEARFAYLTWGVTSKVRALEARHPQFLTQAPGAGGSPTRGAGSSALSRSVELDLGTAIRISQVLSGEIVLDRLLTRIMEFTLQNAGATRGFLLMKEGNQWVVEAEGVLGQEAVRVMQSLPMEQCEELAPAIVSYVVRTRESVVLKDAAREGLFIHDANIVRRQPRSVLCAPLLHQKQLLGVLYLENHLTPGAFTPDRLEFLQLLSSQAAISIVNARLYDRLEQKVEERTVELQAKNSELKSALENLKQTQGMLIQSEKMSSLGHLTAGIAHEIKNPLNFVKNFAELSSELVEELLTELRVNPERRIAEALGDVANILGDLQTNTTEIIQHGNRANDIINGMLLHSRTATGERTATNVNALVEQHVMLAYRGMRASTPGSEVLIEKDFDTSLPPVELVAQGIGRVVLNLINNALYAASARKRKAGDDAVPRVRVSTRMSKDRVAIHVWDNGEGIPASIRNRIFEPFFTTKPPGQGTGLGLSISHDIVVQGHGGAFRLETEEGRYTEFIIELPRVAGSK